MFLFRNKFYKISQQYVWGDPMNKIEQIKKAFESNIGRTVMLSAVKGRKRYRIKECVIANAYPGIFVIKTTDPKTNKEKMLSYSYSDILTGTIEIKLYQNKEIS